MKMLLSEKDLWRIVTGMETQPDGSKPKELADFKRREEKALSAIMLNLDDAQLALVLNVESPFEVWETLKTLYQTKGTANRMYLLRQLYGFPKKDDSNVLTEHIIKLKAIVLKLAAIENTLGTIYFISIMLILYHQATRLSS